nr:hypothetical protein CFP56_65532 [Quercus suber]
MRPVPLEQRRGARVVILLQHLAMQMQAGVVQAVQVDRRDAEHMRAHALELVALADRARRHARGPRAQVAEADERAPAREQDAELVVRRGGQAALAPDLLLVEQAGGELGALREAEHADPGPAAGILALAGRERVAHLLDRRLVVQRRVLGRQPAQPAAEGPAVLVDGHDAGAGVAEEGPVGEDEAELREVLDQGAGLRGEDFGVDAAAMQAEDARKGEVGVDGGGVGGGGGGGRRGHDLLEWGRVRSWMGRVCAGMGGVNGSVVVGKR